MTPALFFLALLPPLIAIVAITIRTCQHITAASRGAQDIIRNNAEMRHNYARARMEKR